MFQSFVESVALASRRLIKSISCLGVSRPVFDFFWNTCKTKTLPLNFTVYTARGNMLLALLGLIKCKSENILHLIWTSAQIIKRRTYPIKRPEFFHYANSSMWQKKYTIESKS